MNVRRLALFVAVVMLVAGSAYSRADFVNGSFEAGNYTFNGQGAVSLQPGSTDITGWRTFGAELAVIKNANSFGLTTPYGDIFLDLTGYHDSAPYGGVSQLVATVIGQTYDVSLYLGVNNSLGEAIGPVSVQVTAGSSSGLLTANPPGAGMIWTQKTFSFVADSTATLVQIQGSSTAGGRFIGLDNVSINARAVPEPASVTLLGIGAVAVLGPARRRRAAARVAA